MQNLLEKKQSHFIYQKIHVWFGYVIFPRPVKRFLQVNIFSSTVIFVESKQSKFLPSLTCMC